MRSDSSQVGHRVPEEPGERSENVAERSESPGVRNPTGSPRDSHAATDGEGGSCWGKVGGEVMGRVIMAPAEKGQAVFMRVFGVSSQNLLFCQRRSRGLVDVTMAQSLRSSGLRQCPLDAINSCGLLGFGEERPQTSQIDRGGEAAGEQIRPNDPRQVRRPPDTAIRSSIADCGWRFRYAGTLSEILPLDAHVNFHLIP